MTFRMTTPKEAIMYIHLSISQILHALDRDLAQEDSVIFSALIDALVVEAYSVEQKFTASEAHARDLELRLAGTVADLEGAERHVVTLNANLDGYDSAVQELHEILDRKDQEIAQLNVSNEVLEKSLGTALAEVEGMAHDTEKMQSLIVELQSTIEDQDVEIYDLRSSTEENAQLRRRISDLEKDLKGVLRINGEMGEEIMRLRLRNTGLERDLEGSLRYNQQLLERNAALRDKELDDEIREWESDTDAALEDLRAKLEEESKQGQPTADPDGDLYW